MELTTSDLTDISAALQTGLTDLNDAKYTDLLEYAMTFRPLNVIKFLLLLARPHTEEHCLHLQIERFVVALNSARPEVLEMILDLIRSTPDLMHLLHNIVLKPLVIDAAAKGDLERLKMLVDQLRANRIEALNTAFAEAARHDRLKVLEYLVDFPEVDPDRDENRAFRLAAKSGHTRIVKFLKHMRGVWPPCEKENQALRKACKNKHPQVVEMILKHCTPSEHCIKRCVELTSDPEVMKLLAPFFEPILEECGDPTVYYNENTPLEIEDDLRVRQDQAEAAA
jgi:ankyrin repeat protein